MWERSSDRELAALSNRGLKAAPTSIRGSYSRPCPKDMAEIKAHVGEWMKAPGRGRVGAYSAPTVAAIPVGMSTCPPYVFICLPI